MNYSKLVSSALVALTVLAGSQLRADNMVTIAITPATGAVTLSPQWAIGGNLAGFHHMAQDLGLTGSVANNFYSIRGGSIPAGGDILAFNFYTAGSGAATPHNDIGSKLTPNSYSALTSADPDVGFGSVNFYLIHHKGTTDYFSVIKPGSAVASEVTDLKPMSAPGGPDTVTGVSGYFGLTFASANLGYGLNQFYYLRTDPVTSNTMFGSLDPALAGTAADQFDLGFGGHNALAFTGTDLGYGTDKMYYLRLDPITGNTILGTLHPTTGNASDIANLGSVYSTLTYSPTDLGFGVNRFYTTGSINPAWQSVSFAAIDDRAITAGSFTVNPTASSALPIVLTVVPGSTGAASISGPVGGVFTVTPTAPGLITLQASQAGATAPIPYAYNMLRQSFTATGTATLAITTQPTSQTAVAGNTATFSVVASGTTALSYQWRRAGANITVNPSATTSELSLVNVQASDAASYDVVVTNASGSIVSDAVLLTLTTAAPVITNSPLTRAGTVGTAFNFTITATNAPASYTASPLPAGLVLNTTTGAITGTPTTVGTTAVLLGATNATGTGNATLTITVAAAGVAPNINNSPLTAGGTVGAPFSFAITASGSPTSFTASPLPSGLVVDTTTGVISGTPTTVATTPVRLIATNGSGSDSAILTVTVAPAGVAPIITNNPLTAAGTVGAPFGFTITASGSPLNFSTDGLPAGLTLNTLTGTITGTPNAASSSVVEIRATNATGTGTATLTITIAATTVPPVITSPASAPGAVGTPFVTYMIAATGLPTSYAATGLPAGLTLNPLTGAINGTPTTAGTYVVTLTATNSAGVSTATSTFTIAPTGVAPIITSPLTLQGAAGTPFVTYHIAGTGLPTSYAATGLPAGLTVNPLTGAISGTPTSVGTSLVTIQATNITGTSSAILTIVVAGPPSSRIVNFSARALSGPGSETLIMGFVVSGDNKNLLVRGIGPGLAPHGVTNFLADPMLTLYGPNGAIATNDDWHTPVGGQSSGTAIGQAAARVGAFALGAGSRDSALISTFNHGAHTTTMLRPASTTGVALTELYDTDTTSQSRLINVSARMNVSAGEGTLIAGLVIAGNAPKTVLIRGVGPTMANFAVTGVLADPQITVFAGGTQIATNNDWGTGTSTAAQISSASALVGAFPLEAGSRDAVLLLTLQPGSYTVQVTGVGNTTGVALVEVYDTE